MESATSTPQDKKKGKEPSSAGEQVFNWGTYAGVNWGINTAISVAATEIGFNRPGEYNFLYNGREALVSKFQEGGAALLNMATSDDLISLKDRFLEQASTLTGDNNEAFQKLLDEGLNKQALYTLYAEHGGFEGMAEQLGEGFTSDSVKDVCDLMVKEQANIQSYSALATIISLCAGGFALVIPLMKLEENKLSLVKWADQHIVDPFNKITGNAPETEQEKLEQQEQRQAGYTKIENEPKQGFASEFLSRVFTLVPVYALHMAWSKPENLVKTAGGMITGNEFVNPDPEVGFGGINHYAEIAGNWTGEKVFGLIPESAHDTLGSSFLVSDKFRDAFGGEALEKQTKQYMEWVCTDAAYTTLVASGSFAMTRVLGDMFDKSDDAAEKEQDNSPKNNIVSKPSNRDVQEAQHDGALAKEVNKELVSA